MTYYRINYSNELYHHGVKGMKWGVRRSGKNSSSSMPKSAIRKKYDDAKVNKKNAYKAWNKSYKKAFNFSYMHPISQNIKKNKNFNKSNNLWEQAEKDLPKYQTAKKTYQNVKKERKNELKKTYGNLKKQASLSEKFMFNSATRKKAAKYIVDNNMTVAEATAKSHSDAARNTLIILGIYGGVNVTRTIADHYRN